MEVNFYSRQAYPKPIDKQGEFSSSPYSITLPNNGYLDDIMTFFPIYDEKTMVYSIDSIPEYPILNEDGTIGNATLEEYKIAGLAPLESYEKVVGSELILSKVYLAEQNTVAVASALIAKLNEAKMIRDEIRDTRKVHFTHKEVIYTHGITETDVNNVTSTITTLNEAKILLGHDDTTVVWAFNNMMSTTLKREDIVQLATTIQQEVSKLFAVRASVIAEINALTSVEAITSYDIRAKFEV